jgi:hypothetical protein
MKIQVWAALLVAFIIAILAPTNAKADIQLPPRYPTNLPVGSIEKYINAVVAKPVFASVGIWYTLSNMPYATMNSGPISKFTNYNQYVDFVKSEVDRIVMDIKVRHPDAKPPFVMRTSLQYDDPSNPYLSFGSSTTNTLALSNLTKSSFEPMTGLGGVIPISIPLLVGFEIHSSGPTNSYTWYNGVEKVEANGGGYFYTAHTTNGVAYINMQHCLSERWTRFKIVTRSGSGTETNDYTQDGSRLGDTIGTFRERDKMFIQIPKGSDLSVESSSNLRDWSLYSNVTWSQRTNVVVIKSDKPSEFFRITKPR